MASRRTHPIVISLLVLLSVGLTASPSGATDFSDVPKWHWAWPSIQGVTDAEVASGYDDGLYRPDRVVTRDQMAVFIARALCGGDAYVPAGPPTPTFPDVPETGYGTDGTEPYWAYDHVEYAVVAGVVGGYPDGHYHPTEDVTRGQMAAFLARAMCGGDDFVPSHSGSPTFPDVTSDNEAAWCYDYVEYIAAEGVTLGYPDGNYYPDVLCSRDQMATYLCRAFDYPMPPIPYNITDHFPLGGADTWTYETQEGLYTKSVTGTIDVWGQTCTQVVDAVDGAAEYWRAMPSGLSLAGFFEPGEGAITFNPFPTIPNGLDPGNEGTEIVPTYLDGVLVGDTYFTYRFWGAETVIVPAGTFEDCMKVEIQLYMDGENIQFFWWLGRGVGVVKMDSGYFGGDEWEVLIRGNAGGTRHPADVGPFRVADYYPLAVGNTWVYDTAEGDEVVQAVGLEDIDGLEAARLDSGPPLDTPDADYLAVIDGALCYVGEYTSDEAELMTLSPPITFPVTAEIGDSGVETSTAYVDGVPVGSITFGWAVVGAGPVTSTAGTFNDCIKLRISITDPVEETTETHTWLALGIGPVTEDERPLGGTWWSELTWADIGSLHYPLQGQMLDIAEYVDLTLGNEWTHEDQYDLIVTRSVTGTYPYGGNDWATIEDAVVDGYTSYCRTDGSGLYYLGRDGGIGGVQERFDPPLEVADSLSIGEGGDQTSAVYESASYTGDAFFEYAFDGIEAVSTEAGLFPDCMKMTYSLHLPDMPTGVAETAEMWLARSVGPVKAIDSAGEQTLVSAAIGGAEYPPDEAVYDVTDYFPLAIGNAWSTIWQGEDWYGAERILVPSTEDLSGLGVTDTVYRVLRYSGNVAECADFWASLPGGLARYGYWDPGMTMAVNPPLVTSNGMSIGDSESGTSTAYLWNVDHWETAGTIFAQCGLLAAGPVAAPAGYFPDCILLRYEIAPPGEDTIVQYLWLARGIGPVLEHELGDGDWSEITGATIDGITVPPDPAPAVVETATISEGAALGFDFSADGMAALPDDQDLSYVYTSATDAGIESFEVSGISRYIGEGAWDFLSLHTYSTFLPPDWDLWGWAWWQSAAVLATSWDAIDDMFIVKTREGQYALVHITDATPTGLDIEYVCPYGWFGWD